MSYQLKLVNKRGGSVDGTFSQDGSVPVLEVRDGKIMAATSRPITSGSGGTVTQINTGAGLAGGPIVTNGTISIAPSGVTAGNYGSASTIPVITVDNLGRITSATSTPASSTGSFVTTNVETVATSTWSGQLELAVCQTGKTVTVCIGNGTTLSATNNNTVFTSGLSPCPPPLSSTGGAANMSFVLPSPSTDAGITLRLTIDSSGTISLRKLDGSPFLVGGTNMVFTNYPICFTYIAE